jgi:hypothetical protein
MPVVCGAPGRTGCGGWPDALPSVDVSKINLWVGARGSGGNPGARNETRTLSAIFERKHPYFLGKPSYDWRKR